MRLETPTEAQRFSFEKFKKRTIPEPTEDSCPQEATEEKIPQNAKEDAIRLYLSLK